MKERPILFSGPMVKAILAGTKTQTRRALYVPSKFDRATEDRRYPPGYGKGEWPNLSPGKAWTLSKWSQAQPGDRLWVRETWAQPDKRAAGLPAWVYAADYTERPAHRWRPSIHMPRWASRITLEVTDVRVERLQDISEADALAEGIVKLPDGGYGLPGGSHYHHIDPRISYWSLWDAINGQGATEANPWVWAASFNR